MSMLLKNKRR